MDPLIGAGLLSGGASILGSIFGSNNNANNIAMQRETNQMAIAENQKNRDFQQQMSSTAYQRSSQDMQAAGLNPMMMFGSGSAASTPSGGTPSLTAPRGDTNAGFANIGDAVNKMVSTAVQAKTFDKMTDEIANLKAARDKTIAETGLTHVQTGLGHQTSDQKKVDLALRELELPGARFSAKQSEDLLSMNDKFRRAAEVAKYGAGAASDVVAPFLNSAKGVKSLLPRRTTVQESGTSQSGNWYDRFRDEKHW